MVAKTKLRKSKSTGAGVSRVTWVWGDREKGIAVRRSHRKQEGKYWYDVHHVKNGKTTHVSRDHSSRASAIREAKGYAVDNKKHPRSTAFW